MNTELDLIQLGGGGLLGGQIGIQLCSTLCFYCAWSAELNRSTRSTCTAYVTQICGREVSMRAKKYKSSVPSRDDLIWPIPRVIVRT